jgi:hypothetical protein
MSSTAALARTSRSSTRTTPSAAASTSTTTRPRTPPLRPRSPSRTCRLGAVHRQRPGCRPSPRRGRSHQPAPRYLCRTTSYRSTTGVRDGPALATACSRA